MLKISHHEIVTFVSHLQVIDAFDHLLEIRCIKKVTPVFGINFCWRIIKMSAITEPKLKYRFSLPLRNRRSENLLA